MPIHTEQTNMVTSMICHDCHSALGQWIQYNYMIRNKK